MSNMTNPSEESSDKYFLAERELWESLEFDWEDWNATVEKILQQQSTQCPQGPQGQDQPRAAAKPGQA